MPATADDVRTPRLPATERLVGRQTTRSRVVDILLAVAAGLLFFVTAWISIPAPNRLLLPLSVGAPELSPLLALVAAVLLALSLVRLVRRRSLNAGLRDDDHHATGMLIFSVGMALWALWQASIPIARFNAAASKAEAALAALAPALGPALGSERRPSMFSLRDFVFGIPSPHAGRDGNEPVVLDEVFAAPDGQPLHMRIYGAQATSTTARRPIIVQVYGGAWQRGNPGDYADFARYFAGRGYVVFAIDYRHAPAYRFPAQRADVRAAMAWIRDRAAGYHADTGRLVMLGRSAGAQLAMVDVYTDRLHRIRGVVSLYGPVDLTAGYLDPPSPDPLHVQEVERAFLGGTPAQVPEMYRDASPITYAKLPQPPTLLLYGGRDNIVEPYFGANLRDSLRAGGNTAIHLQIRWADHAFDAVPNGLSGQLSLYVIERFIAAVTAIRSAP